MARWVVAVMVVGMVAKVLIICCPGEGSAQQQGVWAGRPPGWYLVVIFSYFSLEKLIASYSTQNQPPGDLQCLFHIALPEGLLLWTGN